MGILGKLSLVLADRDGDYIDSLSNYLLKHHAQNFDIHTFSTEESFTAFFSVFARRVNILLAGPGFINAEIPQGSAEIVILLDNGNSDNTGGDVPFIQRYQHSEKVVSALLGLYSAKNTTGRLPAGKGNTLITAFISSSGGAGKSVISAGCSILCSRKGMKVFYLSLEGTVTTGLYFKGNCDQNFSNVLYYLKDKDANPDVKLAGARCTDVSTGVHFFLPPESQLEMSRLQPGDLNRLFESFRSMGVYDAVFVDMPGIINECGIEAMNAADRIVSICGPDSTSMFKSQSWQAELELLERRYMPGMMEKTIHVVNDSRSFGAGSCLSSTLQKTAIVFEECVPLRSVTCGNDLLDSGVSFASGINMLIGRINPAWAAGKHAEAGGTAIEA